MFLFLCFQVSPPVFNRGYLLNIAFMESCDEDVTCVIFHDVDLLPENMKTTSYACHQHPVHLAARVNTTQYK